MPESQHVGYAARTAERFRYEGDPNEVMLRISKEAAADILHAAINVPIAQHPTLVFIVKALESMGIESE